ncbi:MAG: glycosyltransferase family 2 protein [Pseudobutyrivibrio sp.]|uniref:glycosyltransferase family 2 protein n=1 Tax=Pseudobutyrivibrio sp. AR14 TaxID=1520804 RepID=UPI00088A7824|nr:glycosyltransferase family 2 protein [Pseudobutyrivibrio sp. AR14]MBP5326202.1 glycosyltransferase family 2 protein [Pseudobutyrivibrio sp.]MBR5952683.1 glycosyltransferase family 2 protein [Pseudobutyrivibrio sp.]SCY44890.1 Glycosyltransferase involved in cell wall bisynthesis [Pseudobutyrivibrio sp. AR14]
MKKISIMIPCFNEEENIVQIGEACENIIKEQLSNYDYEICYVDNASTDRTRELIEQVCANNKKHKAIFNVTNFGQFNSPFHGICELDGDCVIPVCADFQDPVEMIPVFVHEWEKGHKIVSGVKATSKENGFVYFLRTVYYKTIKKMSSVHMIEHFTGFGLYDKSFVMLLRELKDPLPFIRGIVAEYGEGFNLKVVEYEQPQRRAGVTHNNFYTLYDAAMLSFTSYTKVGLRMMTWIGFIVGIIDVIVAIVYLVLKLTHWNDFAAGNAPMVIGMFLLGAIQLTFMGLMGEYILNINTRTINRPIVVEEKRINFD